MNVLDKFLTELSPQLEKTQRWGGFRLLMRELLALKRPVFIGETGTVRQEGNWGGDGQSTVIWDWVCKNLEGSQAFTVDLDPKATALAQKIAPKVMATTMNSLEFLYRYHGGLADLDLLYLDSMDYQEPLWKSELHHAAELALAYPRLKPGCLIAVDDCFGWSGKHAMVDLLLSRMEVFPIYRGYITIWRRP